MPGIYKLAFPDYDGSRLWRTQVALLGQDVAKRLHPELHARHVEHRRWLSHTRATSTAAHAPSKTRAAAPLPPPRPPPPTKPTLLELPLPAKYANKKAEVTGRWNLPEFITIGQYIFRTVEWLDMRRHEPERIRKRRVIRDK